MGTKSRPVSDDPDNIQKCLNCTKPRCTNCLGNSIPHLNPTQKYQRFYVVQLNPKTKKAIAVYESPRAASDETGISARHIYLCSRGQIKCAGGYLWTTIEPR